MEETKPQILFLGNGLNRAFLGQSWDELLESIRIRDNCNIKKLNCPETLKAILVTNDQLDKSMKVNKEKLYGSIKNNEQRKILQKILSTDFDQILTTNYSYELELAAYNLESITDNKLKKINCKTDKVSRIETKYLLHTFNKCEYNGVQNQVWHIHGEARKPDSMILGHYYYGNLFFKIKNLLNDRKNSYEEMKKNNQSFEISSWIDGFILGDVYVLGFGFGFTEFDLWWLLNRKKREKVETGKIYFYMLKHEAEANYEKLELLKLLGVIPVIFEEEYTYPNFYNEAINDIQNRILKARSV